MGALGLLGMHLKGYGCAGRSRRRVRPGRDGAGGRRLRHPHLRLRPGVAGDERDRQVRLGGAEAAVAARDGRGRADRLLRADRAHRRQRPGEHGDHAPSATGRRAGCSPAPSGGSGWRPSPTSRSSGRRPTRASGASSSRPPRTGFTATPIEPKLSMRASIQCDITLDDVRLPADAVLPASRPQGPVLLPERGPLRDHVGRDGRRPRLLRGRPALRAGAPPVRHADRRRSSSPSRSSSTWCWRSRRASSSRCRPGGSRTPGTLRPEQISFGKLNNVREAIAICRYARTILGGNGITLDYSPLRHANNLESVRTYEGTDEVHTLIMGRAITGIAAFRWAAMTPETAPTDTRRLTEVRRRRRRSPSTGPRCATR